MSGPEATPITLLFDKISLVTHHLLTRVPFKLDLDNWNYGSTMAPLTLEELKVDKIVLSWIFTTLSNTLHASATLKAELRSLKLGDLSMEAYFTKIEWIITIHASLDSPINDEDAIHYALEGLSDKYVQVCGILHHLGTFPDLKTARSMLITKEMQLKSKSLSLPMDSSPSSPMVIMSVTGISCHPTTPNVKSWRQCYNFARGSCRFGKACRFVHDGNAKNNGTKTVSRVNSDEIVTKLLVSPSPTYTPVAYNATNGPSLVPPSPYYYMSPSPITWQSYPSVPSAHHSPLPQPSPLICWSQLTRVTRPRCLMPLLSRRSMIPSLVHGIWIQVRHLNNFVNSLIVIFNMCGYSSVSVGDGHSIPVTNTGHSILPTPLRPLHPNNVLITPHIVKNLIPVRHTCDLYPVTAPSPIPQMFLVSQHTWHQRLGHPGSEVLRRLVSNNLISCNKEKPPVL
nr:ribonuclease H-like domain-containing protein [Tanacetum cinerariifolium]